MPIFLSKFGRQFYLQIAPFKLFLKFLLSSSMKCPFTLRSKSNIEDGYKHKAQDVQNILISLDNMELSLVSSQNDFEVCRNQE